MPGPTLNITDRGRMADLVAALALHAPHHVPLFRAAHDGRLGVAQPSRAGIIPSAQFRRMAARPWAIVLGDDDGIETGPDGWACATRVLGWSRHVIIHAAGGRSEHYEEIATLAVLCRRLVLVQCACRYADAWHEATKRRAPGVAVQRILPAIGPHPLPLDKSKMQ